MISKIISGGQTGADQGALAAAQALGIPTGGWMPKGCLTEIGPRPDLLAFYNLQEHSSSRYPPRTQSNILAADATLIVGNIASSGSALTKRYAQVYKKPLYLVPWTPTNGFRDATNFPDKIFREWLIKHEVRTLNVAGNRESQNPGIFYCVKYFLITNLAEISLRA